MVFPYYPRPEDDEKESGYVTPGVPHTPPSGPTTHPAPQGPVSAPEHSPPPTVSGPGYVMPGNAPSRPTPEQQSSGQGSSSKSDEQGSKGSSQDEDSTDANQAKDETSAQVVLRDIAEVQDDFGTDGIFGGIGWDRLHHYSNPDVIRVQQDIERRPLTFKRCFEQAESPQSALEFIYAFPPDFDESELRHLEQAAQDQSDIRAGMADGGTGDARNDVQESFTLDDVRQFTEIDLANATLDEGEALRYELMLEKVFEFDIEWGTTDANKLTQLQNLAKANVHIVDYLEGVFVNDERTSGLTAFRQYFSESKYGQLKVSLGADEETGGAALGRVPLPESTTKNLDMMFLGSRVNIPAIVHEFGHVISRSVGIASMYDAAESTFRDTWKDQTGLRMDLMIYTNSIVALAGRQRSTHEVWADIFMTAVLDPLVTGIDPSYKQLSVKMEDIYDLPFVGFYDCEDTDNECVDRPVQWRRNPDGSLWNNADAVRVHVGEILSELLLPKNGGDIND